MGSPAKKSRSSRSPTSSRKYEKLARGSRDVENTRPAKAGREKGRRQGQNRRRRRTDQSHGESSDADRSGSAKCWLGLLAAVIVLVFVLVHGSLSPQDAAVFTAAPDGEVGTLPPTTSPPTPSPAPRESHWAALCLPGWTYDRQDPRHCIACPAGKFDGDSISTTPCTACAPGSFAAEGATACSACARGMHDHDSDSATPCIQCMRGKYANVTGSTRCLTCNGVETEHETVCSSCPVGRQIQSVRWKVGLQNSTKLVNDVEIEGTVMAAECFDCPIGQADLDQSSATPCELCPAGSYAGGGGVTCSMCSPGRMDHDSSAMSPCLKCPGTYYLDPVYPILCAVPDTCSFWRYGAEILVN